MVDTDDTRRTIHDRRWTTPGVWHKFPTGELNRAQTILYEFLTLKSGCDLYTSVTYTQVNTVSISIHTVVLCL